MNTTLRATFDEVWWEDDNEDPCEEGGWTDVHNPWGGLKVVPPEDLCGPEYADWVDENADSQIVTLLEAARICAEFPGDVWDWEYNGEASQDMETGHWFRVCLHVGDHAETVFNLADMIRSGLNL